MKKKYIIYAAMLTVAALLCGCGQNNTEQGAAPADGAETKQTNAVEIISDIATTRNPLDEVVTYVK